MDQAPCIPSIDALRILVGSIRMSTITTNEDFLKSLHSLSLQQQRIVAARFLKTVLDLVQDEHLEHAQRVAAKSNLTAEELLDNYHSVYAIYVKTNPRSGLNALDWQQQAKHFVAEACLTCLAPSYEEAPSHYLAQKVAMYCRMARTCAGIDHEGDYPTFKKTEVLLKEEVDNQYRIVSEFLINN
jgi:hypothetical protein